jgi:uncharacterized protein involved in outer membrane biogenesis
VKKIFKLFLILLLLFVMVFIGASIFISLKGKAIAISKLEEALNKEVTIGSIAVSFPLDLKISDLDIRGLLKAEEIYVSFGVIDLLRKNIVLPGLRLLRPQLNIERKTAQQGLFRDIKLGEQRRSDNGRNYLVLASDTRTVSSDAPMSILIKKLVVKKGRVHFTDRTLGQRIFELDIDDINLEARGVSFPVASGSMQFKLSAQIITDKEASRSAGIEGSGWIDFMRKDMQGSIQITDLDGTHFRPYYRRFFSENLKSADINFKADLVARDNDLTADCNLAIKNLLFEEPEVTQAKGLTFLDIIGSSIAKRSRDINLNFVINTKLDNPKIDSAQIKGMVLDKVLETVTEQSPEQTEEDFKGIKQTFEEIGRELEDQFKNIFKKE